MGIFNKVPSKSTGGHKYSHTSHTQPETYRLPPQKVETSSENAPDELGTSKKAALLSRVALEDHDNKNQENPPSSTNQKLDLAVTPGTTDSPEKSSLPTQYTHPARIPRQLTGLSILFRTRKDRQKTFNFGSPHPLELQDVNVTASSGDRTLEGPNGTKEDSDQQRRKIQSSKELQHLLVSDNSDTRKVSDKTTHSLHSNVTDATVCRHPSKRTLTPIALVDQNADDQNPFADVWRTSRSENSSSDPTSSEQSKAITRSSSSYSDPSNRFASTHGHIIDANGPTQPSQLLPAFSRKKIWPTFGDRRLAAISFNALASELSLEPLAVKGNDDDDDDDDMMSQENSQFMSGVVFVGEDKLARRRDRLFGRIRTMRSTLHIKSELVVPHIPNLRRRKTFSSLSFRPALMASLKGRSLETLARLGGCSVLILPGDFAPATLCLPVCFVATINYLKVSAPNVRNLFFDAGDLGVAIQTYDYFAGHVLSAEKEQEKIHMTMRSSTMPSFRLNEPDIGTSGRGSMQVLGIAWTFKMLLAGLPGGILGSNQLYRILVNIYYGRVAKGPPKRAGSRLEGLSPKSYAKVRVISLALVAIASPMQLNLICAVFGLCALLLHETERISELERLKTHRPSLITSGVLSIERLAEIFGPLLTERERNDNPDSYHAIEREIESQRVITLLIENWRNVSRQLRVWEHEGLATRVSAESWTRTVSDSSAAEI